LTHVPRRLPSQFYTGLVAALYGHLRADGPPDAAPYARFIERSGQPALELGCGFGEPLLDLRAMGLEVEGLDSSHDMVTQCHANAAARGLDVVVHEQTIEAMSTGRKYRSIFLAGATFNLLPDDTSALQALVRIREHLAPDGSVLLPLFVPHPTPSEVGVADEGCRRRVRQAADEEVPAGGVGSDVRVRHQLVARVRRRERGRSDLR
jgi:trans-aconitate methyltransferase